jgi:hypothetical protein
MTLVEEPQAPPITSINEDPNAPAPPPPPLLEKLSSVNMNDAPPQSQSEKPSFSGENPLSPHPVHHTLSATPQPLLDTFAVFASYLRHPSLGNFKQAFFTRLDQLESTLHFDMFFCLVCITSFLCPPLGLPVFFHITKGHLLFQFGTLFFFFFFDAL